MDYKLDNGKGPHESAYGENAGAYYDASSYVENAGAFYDVGAYFGDVVYAQGSDNAAFAIDGSDAVFAIDGSDAVFAIDVGTGSIIGVVGVQDNGRFRVLAVEVLEHDNRVMFDGQIHDIGEVARAVSTVRGRLEKAVGIPLEAAYIAAAGRALKTIKTGVKRPLLSGQEIDGPLLQNMEAEALHRALDSSALKTLSNENVAANAVEPPRIYYDYIGYSVTGRYLDGYPISNLLGHHGTEAQVELVATFLPRSVTESLFAVMRHADIVVAGLILEPIAALDAVVSKEMRRLNLALVDIGAGTSDIAITKDGNVFSYTMVPYAGDKVTERICETFLTDFKTGERIKRALYANRGEIKFTDVFGRDRGVSYDEVYGAALPVVREMAAKIAGAVLLENKAPPSALIVVGGGCRLPGLDIALAEALNLDGSRVAIRDRGAIEGLDCNSDVLTGPESVTPFGIAINGAARSGARRDRATVRLNKKIVRMPDAGGHTVLDVLSAAAEKPYRPIGEQGASMSFRFNGEPRTVIGGAGLPATILLNGEPVGPEAPVGYGDEISFKDAEDGPDARVFVSDLASRVDAGTVTCGGVEYYIAPRATINGAECALSAEVHEGDDVWLATRTTLGMFAEEYLGGADGSVFFVNGEPAGEDFLLSHGDEIAVDKGLAAAEAAGGDAAGEIEAEAADDMGGAGAYSYIINGEQVEIRSMAPDMLLVDALNHIVLERADSRGRLMLQLNDAPAKLTDAVHPGDKMFINWVVEP
ncbi:MAG: rod shape-determining protein [Oscillospiraceae bacterium]|nr:rod shape-determining protein [Oscillospiraceae bacterium]